MKLHFFRVLDGPGKQVLCNNIWQIKIKLKLKQVFFILFFDKKFVNAHLSDNIYDDPRFLEKKEI